MEQLQLELFERIDPSECQEVMERVVFGKPKSYCRKMENWTNCEAIGACVWQMWRGEIPFEVEQS